MPSRKPASRPAADDRRDPAPEWIAVEEYTDKLFLPSDPVLAAAREASAAAGLPDIAVTPSQGQFLHLLARMHGAARILEIGALGGYSTICLARALPPHGRLITLEADAKHAEVARANVARAGLADRVELRLGKALDLLPKLAAESPEPFDFFFLDADKQNNAPYFEWAVRLSRPGSVILIDNVVRDGKVAEPDSHDPAVEGIRRLNEAIAAEPRVAATTLQTVGSKGYDGFTLALVTG